MVWPVLFSASCFAVINLSYGLMRIMRSPCSVTCGWIGGEGCSVLSFFPAAGGSVLDAMGVAGVGIVCSVGWGGVGRT